MNTEKVTFRTLRDAIATLTEEQLDDEVYVLKTDSWSEPITSIWQLQEDYYQSDECLEPVSTFEGYDPDEKFEDSEFADTLITKGSIYLMADQEIEREE